ncbi:MAG: alpha/beta fold hydrolase [Roseobacter sp.]
MTWTTRPRSEANGLAVIKAGAGPTVLLLHGVGLCADAWHRQIDALAPHFQVIAPDMPGHGHSRPSASPWGISDYGDHVMGCTDRPVMIVGHSMGALIALDLAIRYRDRVRGVAAFNAIWRRSTEAAAAVRARADQLDGCTAPDPSGPIARWFGDAPSPQRSACAQWLRDVNPSDYKMAYTAFATSDGPPDAALRQIACPALFMTGALEPNSTPKMSHAMAALAPQGHALIVDEAAHMMPMTHADAVNSALLTFAREVWT